MPQKRQNIGRRTNVAKRKRVERQNETEEETAQRNEGNRLHMSQSHATESSQQHEARNEASQVRIRELKQSLSYSDRNEQRGNSRLRMQMNRLNQLVKLDRIARNGARVCPMRGPDLPDRGPDLPNTGGRVDNETFHKVSPFLVEKGITSSVGEVKSTKKLRSGDLLVEVESPKQAKQIAKLNSLSTIPVTVNPHATLNSSKGVISCGELLHESVEKITEELSSQGVTHVRRITIRRDGQLLNTKHLILTFDSAKLPEHIKAGYMRLSVRPYIPNPLRCFKCQRFGHSKTSCRGTLTCARCAEVGHESNDCTRTEKCVNCKGEYTSFSRNCFAWKQEKEIITTKIKKKISYQEARKLVKSQTPTPGNTYVSVAKKSISAPSADSNKDISTVSISEPSDSTIRAPPPITNLPISASPSVAPVSEEASASLDFTDFKLVTNRKKLKKDSPTKTNNSIAKAEKISKFDTSSRREVLNTIPTKDNICTRQSALKSFETKKTTSVDTQLLPMAVLPPLEKTVLQSRESDADAEMSSSSLSEEDALEYDMSEDLEDSPAVNSPPPSSKPQKGDKYKNR
ncbi:hypothetical protein AVEN_24864-1 [Araneus ventricosus]|uniref:CCHC-type domain-containing protein n=2 Tax=Araneus ventricosus TaxID=182803 RepID=A0A4Y2BUA6_ARAVE|nr:hypothetical protein AVEN_24864-1 [Araneus ventricosus]